ncbi:hypothetical protein KR044_005645 [Drosophila immigrans]|nr:hypothetical protein KR044_005645 [Drosophila immigrans]
MAQILGLQFLCVSFLVLTGAGRGCEGGSASSSSALTSALTSEAEAEASAALLSDSESYHDKCAGFECPELSECPDDSSLSESADSREAFYAEEVLLQPQLSPDRERAKRDLQTDLQADCCAQCRCNKCPEQPQCQPGEVLIELSTASGQPGNCCPQFKCGPEPQCEASGNSVVYWLNSCSKCNSCQQPPCQDVCYQADPPHNCMSSDNKLMLNGQFWLEGCIECSCIGGDKQCTAPKGCELFDGQVVVMETSSTSTPTTPSVATSVTTEASVVIQLQTSASIETSMEEVEKKVDSEESIVVPETVETAEETELKTPELQQQTVEPGMKPTVEQELKQIVEEEVKLQSVELKSSEVSEVTPKSAESEEVEANTTISSNSTSDKLEETTASTMESDNTDELPPESTELPELSEEKYEAVTMDGLSTDSTADLPSSTSSTLQQEPQTENSLEESTTTVLDKLELDSTLSTVEPTSSSPAASSSAPDVSSSASSSTPASSSTMSPSTLTTESPAALATSSPAPLTPESTSWHHDTDIRDTEYRLASGSIADASKLPTNLTKSILVIVGIIFSLVLVVVIVAIACFYRRKSMYSKVPHSDSNLSENTHTSDLVLDIDPHYDDNNLPQKQQLKESME